MNYSEANKLLIAKYPGSSIKHINEGRKNHTNMKCRVILNGRIYDYKGSYEEVLKRLKVIDKTSLDLAIESIPKNNNINPFLAILKH